MYSYYWSSSVIRPWMWWDEMTYWPSVEIRIVKDHGWIHDTYVHNINSDSCNKQYSTDLLMLVLTGATCFNQEFARNFRIAFLISTGCNFQPDQSISHHPALLESTDQGFLWSKDRMKLRARWMIAVTTQVMGYLDRLTGWSISPLVL